MKTRSDIQSPPGNNPFADGAIRAFLVDDDPFMLALLARLLAKDPRITIIGSATDGRKAFHSAAVSHPDLVLTNLHMPIMDGLEVTRRLKKLSHPPVVFVVTSDAAPEALIRCLGAGADEFFVKAPDLHLQLQMAMENFFPTGRQNTKASNQTYELVAANH